MIVFEKQKEMCIEMTTLESAKDGRSYLLKIEIPRSEIQITQVISMARGPRKTNPSGDESRVSVGSLYRIWLICFETSFNPEPG